MNSNPIKGTARNLAGKVQRTVGEVADNRSRQAKGAARQVDGKTQETAGDLQNTVKKASTRR